MKPTPQHYNLALVGLVILLALGAWRPQATTAAAPLPAIQEDDCNTGRSIQVAGAAVVYIGPDRALIQLGVQSNGKTPEATQNANIQEIQKVMNAVRALGIEAKDIATDYYIVYPIYDDYSSLVITGYRIDNTVSITVRDVNLADDIIVSALRAGANEVQDVEFYTSELRKFRDQAREMAMIAAGEKAQAIAGAAGAQAGCVLNISENTWTHYYGTWRGGRQAAMWAQNVVQNASQGESLPVDDSPVSLGQIAIRAEVNASYSLR
jgi:uncharacterized protein YggE